MKTGIATVSGTSLFYETMGEGFPLVFVSGGGIMDRRAWDGQFEAFARDYKVIRYDVRGIGESARPDGPFSHSRDLFELFKFLNIDRAHIVGLSVGGAIAIDFAIEHPEKVDGLILAASGVSDDSKAEANVHGLMTLSTMTKTEGIEHVIKLVLDTPFVVSAANELARERIRQIYLDNRDVFESDFPIYLQWEAIQPAASQRLGNIRARTLVIRGDNDSPAYSMLVDKIASGIRGSSKAVIPGGTHFLNLEKPNEFNHAVREFLTDVGATQC
jgi:3-oxoadipate enol-lactonase